MSFNADKLVKLLESPVDALGYELWHLQLVSHAGETILRLYIDAPGGIGVDDCEAVSRQVSAILDVEDAVSATKYALEVSSPGLDRPLVTPAHFRRYAGREVRVVMSNPTPTGRRKFAGRLCEVSDVSVVIEVDGERYDLAYDDMDTARLAADLGKRRR